MSNGGDLFRLAAIAADMGKEVWVSRFRGGSLVVRAGPVKLGHIGYDEHGETGYWLNVTEEITLGGDDTPETEETYDDIPF